MSKIAFKLAEGFSALRHALPGGHEIAIDAGSTHLTDDPHEVAALDGHPAAVRAEPKSRKKKAALDGHPAAVRAEPKSRKKKAASRPAPAAVAAPAPAGDEEVVS
jgi:hypothetical protein